MKASMVSTRMDCRKKASLVTNTIQLTEILCFKERIAIRFRQMTSKQNKKTALSPIFCFQDGIIFPVFRMT
jgi:hypothetical protein